MRYLPGVDYHFIPYPNPLIGSVFSDDMQFVKFAENFDYYTRLTPRIGRIADCRSEVRYRDTGLRYFDVPWVDYPVMFLDDIELHFIHEPLGREKAMLRKWRGRLEEGRDAERVFVWADAELVNLHSDAEREEMITRFLAIPDFSIFLSMRPEDAREGNNFVCRFVPQWQGRSTTDRSPTFTTLFASRDEIADRYKAILDEKFGCAASSS